MKKPIFAVAALFIFMFTVVSGFSAENEAEEYTTTSVYADQKTTKRTTTKRFDVTEYTTAYVTEPAINETLIPVTSIPDISNISGTYAETAVSTEEEDYSDFTTKELLEIYLNLAKTNLGQWDEIEADIIRLIDYIENVEYSEMDDVLDTIEDLEAYNVPGAEPVLETLKEKIKAMYAGEVSTTATHTTTEPATTTTTVPETTTEPGCNCEDDDSLCDIFSDLFECIETFFYRLFNYIINIFC